MSQENTPVGLQLSETVNTLVLTTMPNTFLTKVPVAVAVLPL